MIPKQMDVFLQEVLPERTWSRRLERAGSLAFMEFRTSDVERLNRLGIEPDKLGPRLVVCMWDAESDLEIGGYLVVDNLAMGRPSMGGIRMLPDVRPSTIFNLARGMTLKNAAADLPYGGGKSGIVAPERTLSEEDHDAIVQGWARLLYRYRDIYLPGPDVGTNDSDMKTIAIEHGLDCALSKPVDMGGNRIDQLGGAAGGVVIAIDALLDEMERLKVLPQFANMEVPAREDLTLLIQGFGAVGAHAAAMLMEWDPKPRIVGVSDAHGYLFNKEGLPAHELFVLRDERGIVTFPYFNNFLFDKRSPNPETKFSNAPNDLLRESAFCLVPAAPVANYLDVAADSNPSMTTDRMGDWAMIVEGANTYSPIPARRAARMRMERTVYWQAGSIIASDFLVNSGGVIFAAQEHMIKTPPHLRPPDEALGDREAINRWLTEHQSELAELAGRRLEVGIRKREEVIRRNMKELVDFLVADPDLLPVEAAEQISINRIASSERFRRISDIMEPLPTISLERTVREAAQMLLQDPNEMLGVVGEEGSLVGVVTDWDITKATATAGPENATVSEIMTRDIISASPEDHILDILHILENFEISAMPVVDNGDVVGIISNDILAQKALTGLLQAQG